MQHGLKQVHQGYSAHQTTQGIAFAEALELMGLTDALEIEALLSRANAVRAEAFGNQVRLCAISNAKSGACGERCDFCSQSAHFAPTTPSFPLKSEEQLLTEAKHAEAMGAREFSIVTSGRRIQRAKELETLVRAIKLIRSETRLEPCASLGELPHDILCELKEAGLLRYHHNIETAPSYHASIVHSHSFADEVEAITSAQKVGLTVCCGGILGMGESIEQRVEMAFALREIGPHCIPLNFLDPRPGTPLENQPLLTPLTCLQIIAVFRLVLPQTPLFVCGGRVRVIGPMQHRIFDAGASGAMIGDYLTTPGRGVHADREMIRSGGYSIEPPSR